MKVPFKCRHCGHEMMIVTLPTFSAKCPACNSPIVPADFKVDHKGQRIIAVRFSSNGDRQKQHTR